MNATLKRRLLVVTGLIVIVLVVVMALVAGTSGYKTLTVAQALDPAERDARVQVTGKVVSNSYAQDGSALTFLVYDEQGDPSKQLAVRYVGGVTASFGNEVTAICTGRLTADGVLECTELVTKCPSKYESAVDALNVSQVLGYGASVIDKPLKVTGTVKPGTLKAASPGGQDSQSVRLVLTDIASGEELPILFSGALSNDITEQSTLVITGALNAQGRLLATDVALRE